MVRDLFKGLEKENKSKRAIVGLWGHRPQPTKGGKTVVYEKPSQTDKSTQVFYFRSIIIQFKHVTKTQTRISSLRVHVRLQLSYGHPKAIHYLKDLISRR